MKPNLTTRISNALFYVAHPPRITGPTPGESVRRNTMKPNLTRIPNASALYYISYGVVGEGAHSNLRGDYSGLFGDCSGLFGDCSKLRGNCSGLRGNCSGLSGDLDGCGISEADREAGVNVASLVRQCPEGEAP